MEHRTMIDSPLVDQATRLRELAKNSRQVAADVAIPSISVSSGKGGVGKSSIAVNIAIQLSLLGKKILLVDGDQNLANIDILLGLSPKYRLGDVLRGEREIDEILIRFNPMLTILPGCSGDVDYPADGAERTERLIEEYVLPKDYDLVLIDNGAGLSRDVVALSLQSGYSLIVMTPEPTSVMDAYAMLKTVYLARKDQPFFLLVNMVRNSAEADETIKKFIMVVDRFLQANCSYLGCVPYDLSVSRAVSEHIPFSIGSPSSAAAGSLDGISRKILKTILSF